MTTSRAELNTNLVAESASSPERINAPSKSDVQSIDRAVSILNAFTPAHPELGVSEIARMTGLSRSTAHRLLASLHVHGLVRQTGHEAKYVLGPHVLRLANTADHSMDLRSVARDLMARLRDEATETVGLHVFEPPRYRVTIDQCPSRRPLRRIYTELGPVPVHQGAPGKVLMAFMAPEGIAGVLAGPLEEATERTITDVLELRAELTKVAAQGYAFSLQERVIAVSALAVPVFDHRGSIAAALSISGPTTRLDTDRLTELVPLAQRAAAELSARLGH